MARDPVTVMRHSDGPPPIRRSQRTVRIRFSSILEPCSLCCPASHLQLAGTANFHFYFTVSFTLSAPPRPCPGPAGPKSAGFAPR
nr:hypothetical protein CFP56_52895 [Quercus suber]